VIVLAYLITEDVDGWCMCWC